MDRFEEMQTFVRIVDSGSLTIAAERLGTAKSAVSRRLSDLEARLGVQLINRTTRRLNLTDSGRFFYERCQRLLGDLNEAEQSVSQEHASLSGTIRIAAPLSFGVLHLAPVLNDFLKIHPELNLDIDLNDRMVNLMEEGVDLALRIGKLEDSTLIARKLFDVEALILASPEYLKRNGMPGNPEELASHHCLGYSNMPDASLWEFESPQGETITVRVPLRLRANNGDVLLKAAVEGLGIAVSPAFLAHEALEDGRLVQILPDYSGISAGYALYPSQRYLPQRVRVLIDFLVERYGQSVEWKK